MLRWLDPSFVLYPYLDGVGVLGGNVLIGEMVTCRDNGGKVNDSNLRWVTNIYIWYPWDDE